MCPSDIKEALEDRGWAVEICRQSTLPQGWVPVQEDGLFQCVDGRPSDTPGPHGPKALGGVYALVTARNRRDVGSLIAAVSEVRLAGYTPTVHGDERCGGHAEEGCGYFRLWAQGQLEGLSKPRYTARQGHAAVWGSGGVYETRRGEHKESCVLINLVEGTTYEPQTPQSFVVDAWVMSRFEDVDIGAYLLRAAETVEKLNGPRRAIVVVEG